MASPSPDPASPLAHLPLSDPRCQNLSCIAYATAFQASQAESPWTTLIGYGHWNAYYYSSVILLFALVHAYRSWSDSGPLRPASTPSPSIRRKAVALFRFLSYRRFTSTPFSKLGLPTWGVVAFFVVSHAWVAAVAFGPQPYFRLRPTFGPSPLAIRTGAMAVSCLPVVVALAGKANLVTLLTGIGHEKLNAFHRFVALMAFGLALAHAGIFLATSSANGPELFNKFFYMPGSHLFSGVLTLSMFFGLVAVANPWLRRQVHELFYHLHVVFYIAFMGFLFYHTRSVGDAWNYLYATTAIWGISVLTRTFHFNRSINPRYRLFQGWSSHVRPLAGDLTRIDVKVPTKFTWRPGQHVFLRCPSLSVYENHPFSIATSPTTLTHSADNTTVEERAKYMTFFVRSHSGFTQKLARHAHTNHDISTSFWVDGPYGGIRRPIERHFDTVLLIAGGSGVTAVLPWLHHVANQMALGRARTTRVTLAWVVRDAAHLAWVDDELWGVAATMAGVAGRTVEMRFFVTPAKGVSSTSPPSPESSLEKTSATEKDMEKAAGTDVREETEVEAPGSIIEGRPDIEGLVAGVVAGMPRSIVIGCGPETLRVAISNACATAQRAVLRGEAEEVSLYTETFGW